MTKPRASSLLFWAGGLAGFILAASLLGFWLSRKPTDVGQARRLPDGSVLVLERAVFVARNYTYTERSSPGWLRFIAPVLPGFVRNHISWGGGSFGFGLDENTNLVVITANWSDAKGWFSRVDRLRVVDEAGEVYDACWGANTLGMPGRSVKGWTIRSFPRRSRTLRLQFLAERPEGGWTNAAEFLIPNELFRLNVPEWKPEPMLITHTDGDLAVTLQQFQSGAVMENRRGADDPATAARKTRLVFTFAENGRPSADWSVQKLTISDASGNRWSPYLDFFGQEFSWATNGTVEFFGALWPGEPAWALEVEAGRTRGFQSNELWEVSLPLPSAGTVAALTQSWTNAGATVRLVGLASPNTDHPGDFRWLAKWWGPQRNQVYSLAVQLGGHWQGRRLRLVKVTDQSGAELTLVGQQGEDKQGLFLRPNDSSLELRLTFALPRSRFVRFLAPLESVQKKSPP